jgi:hypothetical protein
MKTTPATNLAATPVPMRDARLDWTNGRVIGFSVPDRTSDTFEVVQLHLDGQCVVSAVANRSVFELARELAGLELPAREHSAFELRIPARGLNSGMTSDSVVHLEVKTAAGEVIFDYYLAGLRDLLRLTDVPPTDLLYDVRFRSMADGALHGTVVDRHRTGLRPTLFVTLNHHAPEPLPIYESSADGTVHHFSVPVRPDRLVDGANIIRIAAVDGQPLAAYPISLGMHQEADSERRLMALEAELAFLKKMVLSQNLDALPARLTLLKGEIIGICSEMMTLQRVNLEREVFGVRADTDHVHRVPDVSSAEGGNAGDAKSSAAKAAAPAPSARKARAN